MSIQFELEQMNPYIEAIVKDLQAIGEDTNGKFHSRADEVLEFAEFFREALPSCCAFHRFQEIAELQIRAFASVKHCQCNDVLNHQLLQEIIDIIGKHMNECTIEAAIKQTLAERVN